MATPADAGEVRAIYAPFVARSAASFELDPPDVEEMTRRIGATIPDYPWLVALDAGRVVAYAYGGRFRARPAYRWTVETTVYVREGCHGRGVGTTIYKALLACLRVQGFRTVVAGVALPNDASVALHRRLGFQEVGVFERVGFKFGSWQSVWWSALDLQQLPDPPPEPLSCADAVALPPWAEAMQIEDAHNP